MKGHILVQVRWLQNLFWFTSISKTELVLTIWSLFPLRKTGACLFRPKPYLKMPNAHYFLHQKLHFLKIFKFLRGLRLLISCMLDYIKYTPLKKHISTLYSIIFLHKNVTFWRYSCFTCVSSRHSQKCVTLLKLKIVENLFFLLWSIISNNFLWRNLNCHKS